ncbi:xanthine dehydrogenase-like [Dendronephthya gigantea]|uniref:xanthine dehydrogenase-like n=1 Tax=Dendronephthya gigantea TaxID=151771 RepID=UPI00106A7EB0|nr:xanthine dehydrogenase-like [Dendronephthya gigantea]
MSGKAIVTVRVEVNGVKYLISNTSSTTSLNEWLRSQPGLKGTKVTCQEGGCGACVVVLTKQDLATKKDKVMAVNSCLLPLFATDGCKITTTEGLGSSRSGYHPIQERIAQYNGSQCGFCTPGMVMSMYGLLSKNAQPTKQDIEDGFDGNLCRCTGFRPILDAMKSFAKDENPIDIEDLYTVLDAHDSQVIRFVVGNTGKGVYKDDSNYDVFINIADVPELNTVQVTETSLQLGAALSLNKMIAELRNNSSKSKSFEILASHIKKVGCWAGNLMMIHKHRDFPSDMFIIMCAVGATVVIGKVDGSTQPYCLEDFLNVDMRNKVILRIDIPFTASDEFVRTFKIMPRHQNAHAYVNAGFKVTMDSTYIIKGIPSLMFGGVKLSPFRASSTQQYLSGKNILDSETLKGCMNALDKEIIPESTPLTASAEYRKSLALSLFYKFYLSLLGDKASSRVISAAVPYVRPISSGQQSFGTTPSEFPLTQPMTKTTAKLQASGEAQYTDDIPRQEDEIYGAFVTTTQKLPGVLKYISAKDIPGENDFVPDIKGKEKLFCECDVEYAGQAVGMIIAMSQSLADEAAEKVKITYSDCKKPIISIQDAIEASSFFSEQIVNETFGDVDGAMASSTHIVSGEISVGTQHHFHMETHTCLCIPSEEEMKVYASTQSTETTQISIAQVLNIPQNSVSVSCKRCGGGFGGKGSRAAANSTACALAAYIMNKPVRLRMNLKTNMEMIGKRYPYLAKYKIGAAKEGLLKGIDLTCYAACGIATTECYLPMFPILMDNAYYCENWKFQGVPCKTNTATSSYTRSPGRLPATFIAETMMNHLAKTLNMSQDEIREINFYKKGQTTYYHQPLLYCNMTEIWQELKKSSEVDKRRTAIESFNKENRWRKRGISLVPMRWGVEYKRGFRYTAYVAIFRKDGTMAISHGGVEIGQGIDTKVCQVAAYTLGFGLTVDKISIKPATSFLNPNGSTTAASITSELCCEAIIQCCNMLKERISPVAKDMPQATWAEIIHKCYEKGVDLSAKYMILPKPPQPAFNYNIFAATCTEAEIDVLTGETEILRTDILFDCGKSMNPEIDIGQVEGAFRIMGLGYWLTEKAIYDPLSGLELTNGTWDYHPSSSKDIPIDFRVSLLKNAPNPLGVLGSKAAGEPPLSMSSSCLFAVQDAIYHAREETGQDKGYFPLDGPATVEATHLKCLVDPTQFII